MPQTHTVRGRSTVVQLAADGLLHRVIYHQTSVVEWVPGEGMRLDSGGWRTYTTKLRMNQAARQFDLGYAVFSDRGTWYVMTFPSRAIIPFVDGMIVRKEGA